MSWADFNEGFQSSSKFHSKMAVNGKPGGWEGLRKSARSLENDIDVKLVSYSKLGTSIGRASRGPADKQPLISQSDSVEQLGSEIENLIDQLSKVNTDMSEFAGAPGTAQSAAIHHTLQRHTEILQDYRQEFRKTAANITSLMERDDLLSSVHSDISDFRNKDKVKGTRMDALLRESEHTRNSERLIDEQINIALETRENLVFQRETIKMFQKKLNDLTNRFPLINSLVNRISIRKRRDTIILGTVIGLCLTFCLWWIFG